MIGLKEVTAWKVSKYGVFSGPYFPAFEPEKTPYLDTFHVVGETQNTIWKETQNWANYKHIFKGVNGTQFGV